MKDVINKTVLAFRALWCKAAEEKLYRSKAEADLAEATELLQQLPAKLEADIEQQKIHTAKVIEQCRKDGEVAILHLQRQSKKRQSDLEFIIANAKVELNEK